jgi:hypothetical protein
MLSSIALRVRPPGRLRGRLVGRFLSGPRSPEPRSAQTGFEPAFPARGAIALRQDSNLPEAGVLGRWTTALVT